MNNTSGIQWGALYGKVKGSADGIRAMSEKERADIPRAATIQDFNTTLETIGRAYPDIAAVAPPAAVEFNERTRDDRTWTRYTDLLERYTQLESMLSLLRPVQS